MPSVPVPQWRSEAANLSVTTLTPTLSPRTPTPTPSPKQVGGSRFEGNLGGAVVAAAGSHVLIAHSALERNEAEEGGALSVSGGNTTVHLVGTRVALNVATTRGGGLHVTGGVVALSNRTVLEDNSAPEGHTMQLLGGATSYYLPAPAGRWVNTAVLDTERGTLVSAVALGAHVEDYPFPCREGHVGSDDDISTQLNPDCVGPCPAGKICTANPALPLTLAPTLTLSLLVTLTLPRILTLSGPDANQARSAPAPRTRQSHARSGRTVRSARRRAPSARPGRSATARASRPRRSATCARWAIFVREARRSRAHARTTTRSPASTCDRRASRARSGSFSP